MQKLLVTTLALSLSVVLAGCQSLDGVLNENTQAQQNRQPASVGVHDRTQVNNVKIQPHYEDAPDLSNAEELQIVSADQQSTQQNTQQRYNGSLSNDINPVSNTTSSSIHKNVALADRLETAQPTSNTMLQAADPYASVTEVPLDSSNSSLNSNPNLSGINTTPVLVNNTPNDQLLSGADAVGQVNDPYVPSAPKIKDNYPQNRQNTQLNELAGYKESGGCTLQLHTEASGIARVLIKEIAGRLRAEHGAIFVAPTIIAEDYNDCIHDLSTAIQDGLLGSQSFQVVSGNQNLTNVISQNIGSATVIPGLIHQCRATNIPYLVISQVRKTGDKAALSIRIIRTDDGITLSQTYRRLSQ